MMRSATELDEILAEVGQTRRSLSEALGITRAAVDLWANGKRRIHAEVCVEIEQAFGIARHRLRPDLWIDPALLHKPAVLTPPPLRARKSRKPADETVSA